MNIEIYSGMEIQLFINLCNQAETEGITDIRFIRERLSSRLSDILLQSRRRNPYRRLKGINPARLHSSGKMCPSCGRAEMIQSRHGTGEIVCPECRYSELIEVIE